MQPSYVHDPRDRAFFEYWTRKIDQSDPAAPHWMDHCAKRIDEGQKFAERIAAHLNLDGARALDVGCQTGALAIALSARGAQVTGVDTAEWLLEAARLRCDGWGARAHFRVARGEELPFEDQSFDLVTFIDVIEHCQDAQRCLYEIARVLRPGGVAYVYGPNRFAPEWFVSDPHYGLAFASVLPKELGRRYVEWRRGRPGYDVGVFPVGNLVGRTLRRAGLELIDSPVHAAERWWRARAPGALRGLVPLARAWGTLRFAAVPLFEIVARRPRSGSAE